MTIFWQLSLVRLLTLAAGWLHSPQLTVSCTLFHCSSKKCRTTLSRKSWQDGIAASLGLTLFMTTLYGQPWKWYQISSSYRGQFLAHWCSLLALRLTRRSSAIFPDYQSTKSLPLKFDSVAMDALQATAMAVLRSGALTLLISSITAPFREKRNISLSNVTGAYLS